MGIDENKETKVKFEQDDKELRKDEQERLLDSKMNQIDKV